jgi:hypothetical protein
VVVDSTQLESLSGKPSWCFEDLVNYFVDLWYTECKLSATSTCIAIYLLCLLACLAAVSTVLAREKCLFAA